MSNIKKTLYVLIFILVSSCKSTYDTKPFTNADVPKAPDYNNLNSWAAHPELKNSPISEFYNKESKAELLPPPL
jgi:hypothetical protein